MDELRAKIGEACINAKNCKQDKPAIPDKLYKRRKFTKIITTYHHPPISLCGIGSKIFNNHRAGSPAPVADSRSAIFGFILF